MSYSPRDAAFLSYALSSGILADFSSDEFHTRFSAWKENIWTLGDEGTHFGFVYSSLAKLSCASGTFALSAGMYFSVPGAMKISGGSGVLVTRLNYRGFFQLGGPVEACGRLRYIDGCTDSLLLAPVMRGDPCLNLLHFPKHTQQTAHTHPSLRAGLVIGGAGECVTENAASGTLPHKQGQVARAANGKAARATRTARIPLKPGLAFVILPDSLHSFHTQESELLVIAYHPDSDFGPTHENHPMINRTIIAAESAKHG